MPRSYLIYTLIAVGQARQIAVPSASALAIHTRTAQLQDKVEQQHLKRLVLNYEQREEAEELKGIFRLRCFKKFLTFLWSHGSPTSCRCYQDTICWMTCKDYPIWMIISRDILLVSLTAIEQDGSSDPRLHTTAIYCWLDSGPSLLWLAFYIRSTQKVAHQLILHSHCAWSKNRRLSGDGSHGFSVFSHVLQ